MSKTRVFKPCKECHYKKDVKELQEKIIELMSFIQPAKLTDEDEKKLISEYQSNGDKN